MYQDETVADIVREMESEDVNGNTVISKYVELNQREIIERIDAYLNSKHISGSTDSMGRDKPFFNIVTSLVNIWFRATDIDRKNISLTATKKSDILLTFCANIILKKWMKKAKIGQWLNEWGRVMARYGSAISKFTEKNGDLIAEVMPWNRMIVDPVSFYAKPVVEKLYMTPSELRAKKEYDQEMVDALIEAKVKRETVDGQKKDNFDDFIEIYEVHGELPLAFITEEEDDWDEYTQQMHVIAYDAIDAKQDEFNDFTLYKGREKKNPYRIDHLIKEDGRTMAIGAVEHAFEAQWMVNHTAKSIKDQLDLASKLIFQTSDGNFVGQNALNSIETGDIMIHQQNQPLTQLANNSHDIGSLQAFGQQWKGIAMEIDGINEAMTSAPKSGTAWRQTEAALQEAHSLFELMIENKGLALEEIITDVVIPYIKTKLDTTEELAEILESHEIDKIDAMFVPREVKKRVNKKIFDDILNKSMGDVREGKLMDNMKAQEMATNEEQAIQGHLKDMGNQRFIKPSEIDGKTWKKALEGFEWRVDVDITGENKDKNAILTTLSNVFTTLASNPMVLQDPNAKMVFNRILEETHALSPVEIQQAQAQPQLAQPMPAPQPIINQ